MNRISILLLLFIMFFTAASYAQKKQGGAMQWEIAACLPASNGHHKALGVAGPVVGIHENVLVVAGGANFPDSMPWVGGAKKYYDEVYVYIKKEGKLVLHNKTFKLPSAVAYAAGCSLPRGIIYAGGENEKGISNKVFLLQWDPVASDLSYKKLPDLPVALTNAAVGIYKDRLYVAGGEMENAVSDKLYCLDINNLESGWEQLSSVPKQVSHAVAVIQSHKGRPFIYLVGGRRKNINKPSDFYNRVFRFDIVKNQWEERSPLPYKLAAGTGIATDSGLLMFGGDKGETFHKVEEMIIGINAETDASKKQQLVEQKNKLQSSHPGFSREILSYNVAKDTWTIIDKMPFNSPVTTTAVRWNNKVIIPSGEIRAGVRTGQILMGK